MLMSLEALFLNGISAETLQKVCETSSLLKQILEFAVLSISLKEALIVFWTHFLTCTTEVILWMN